MGIFVIVHGAWTGGWAWRRLRGMLQAQGHEVHTPTLTGLGERSHLAHAGIDLETHVKDVLAVLEHEDLSDVVLLAHSYGGMVGTGVLHRTVERIGRVVYIDAFVPRDGQCLFDLLPAGAADKHRQAASRFGDGWRIPPMPLPDDTSVADVAWITARRTMQPMHTFDSGIRLPHVDVLPPRHFVYCTKHAPGDVFKTFADRARQEPGWQCHTLAASHSPHVTAARALCGLLNELLTHGGERTVRDAQSGERFPPIGGPDEQRIE